MGMNRAKFHYDHYYPEMNLVLGSYVIWQAGDLQCEPGYTVDAHKQMVHEISYIVSGQGTFILNDGAYPVRKGDVFIDRIGDVHTIISSAYDPLRYQYIGFDFKHPIALEAIARIKDFWDHFSIPLLSGTTNIQEPFIDFLSEIKENDFLSKPLMECYVQRIICEVYRQYHRNQPGKYLLSKEKSIDEKLVYDIAQYLEANTHRTESLSDLCGVFGYSYSHIARSFKTTIGETLSAYCQRRRFERAQTNMRRGMSITEVAEAAGYKSIHAFSRAYKQWFGGPPTKYVESLGKRAPEDMPDKRRGSTGAAGRLHVAVIGCGAVANAAHIPQYLRHPQANLIYLCDIDPLRSLESVKRYQCGTMVTDYRVVARDPQVDAVSICTPNDLHAPLVVEFLGAGKAVLCEMPAARTLEGVLNMRQAMRGSGQVLLIGMDNRYDSDVGLIRRMILGGQLGGVYHVYISFRFFRRIPDLGGTRTTRALSGGGVLMDQGIRYLDTALYCLGGPSPVTVSASTFSYLGRNIPEYVFERMEGGPPKHDGIYDVEDSLSALVRTEGPVLTLHGAWAQNIQQEEAYIDFMGDTAGIRYTPGSGFVVYGAENGALISYAPSHPRRDPFEAEIEHFLACVARKACPEDAMDQTVTTMRVVQAIYDSAARHEEIELRSRVEKGG